jgi:hypothetical protein
MNKIPTELPDDDPDCEGVLPDLNLAGDLLEALAREDYDAIQELKDSAEGDWWNVAWTLALLLRGFRAGEPSSVALVESLLGSEPEVSDTR